MLSHVSLGTNDAARAAAFYDPVLAVLGIREICERGLFVCALKRRARAIRPAWLLPRIKSGVGRPGSWPLAISAFGSDSGLAVAGRRPIQRLPA